LSWLLKQPKVFVIVRDLRSFFQDSLKKLPLKLNQKMSGNRASKRRATAVNPYRAWAAKAAAKAAAEAEAKAEAAAEAAAAEAAANADAAEAAAAKAKAAAKAAEASASAEAAEADYYQEHH
jgi:hypothetical protein